MTGFAKKAITPIKGYAKEVGMILDEEGSLPLFYEEHLGPYHDGQGNTIRGMSMYELNKERVDRQSAEARSNRNRRKRKRK